jgi:hypothetical protein
MSAKNFDGWVSVFESGIDYEAEMVRDRLQSSGIEAVIMAKKDRSFQLTVGAMSRIYVLVSPDQVEEAAEMLQENTFSSDELTDAALAFDPERAEGLDGHSNKEVID